jgi:hypothetical protein
VPEQSEGLQQTLLHQVLGVPEIARETTAIGVKLWPQRLHLIEVTVPARAQHVAHLVRELDLVHGILRWVSG